MLDNTQVEPGRLMWIQVRFSEINSAVMKLIKERYCTRCHYQWLPVKLEKVWEYIWSSQVAERLSHSLGSHRWLTLIESGYLRCRLRSHINFSFRHFVKKVDGGTLVESRAEYMFKMFPISHALLPVTKRLSDKV